MGDFQKIKKYLPLGGLISLILLFTVLIFTVKPKKAIIPPISNQVPLNNVVEETITTLTPPIESPSVTEAETTPSEITPTPIPTITSTVPATSTPAPVATSASQASISGTITFTGQAPLNSRIVIFQRVSGTQNYQVAVDNVTPYNGTTWAWGNSVSGTTYDLLAILKQKQSDGTDVDKANSNTLTLTAPTATGSVFTLNYSSLLSAPAPNISVKCNNLNGSTLNWAADILFHTVEWAKSYWYKIGTTDDGTDLANLTQNAKSGDNQTISQSLKNGTTYFAKYAYSSIADLASGDSQFSTMSSTMQLKCAQ